MIEEEELDGFVKDLMDLVKKVWQTNEQTFFHHHQLFVCLGVW